MAEFGEANEKSKGEIPPIYDGELNYKELRDNPILKPVAITNNSYINFELIIRKSLLEYEEHKKKIDKLVEANPKYSETILLGVVNDILRDVKTIIHAQDCQKDNLVEVVREMIEINKEEYAVVNEDEELTQEPVIEEKPKIVEEKKEEIVTEKLEEKDEPKEETFHSDLLEKEIPKPKKGEKFIPIKK